MVNSKELSTLIKAARSQGWEVGFTKGSHLRWTAPNGRFFFSASTPSDYRALKNIKRDLRMHGFIEIKQKGKRR